MARDKKDSLSVKQDILGSPFIPGLTETPVANTQEVMNLVEIALREPNPNPNWR